MNVINRFLIIILACLLSSSFTSNHSETNLKIELSKWHNGVLLVRLKTQENRIKILEKKGRSLEAKELEYERRQYHRALREAFEEYYTFSQVYFFFNRDSHSILTGEDQGLLFGADGKKTQVYPYGFNIFLLDSYFPSNRYFKHHNEHAGFIIKKVGTGGIPQRLSKQVPFTFNTPTTLQGVKDINRLRNRIKEFNTILWKQYAAI